MFIQRELSRENFMSMECWKMVICLVVCYFLLTTSCIFQYFFTDNTGLHFMVFSLFLHFIFIPTVQHILFYVLKYTVCVMCNFLLCINSMWLLAYSCMTIHDIIYIYNNNNWKTIYTHYTTSHFIIFLKKVTSICIKKVHPKYYPIQDISKTPL